MDILMHILLDMQKPQQRKNLYRMLIQLCLPILLLKKTVGSMMNLQRIQHPLDIHLVDLHKKIRNTNFSYDETVDQSAQNSYELAVNSSSGKTLTKTVSFNIPSNKCYILIALPVFFFF